MCPAQMPQPGSSRKPICCVMPEDHRAGERAPERAHAADDHGLECEEQQQRPVRWRHGGAHALQRTRDGNEHEGDGGREGVDLLRVQAHQLGDLAVVGHGAKRTAQRRAREQPLQRAGRHDGDGQHDQRQHAQRERIAERHALRVEPTGFDGARVGREQFEQQVLDDDRQAEGDDQRRQRVFAERAVEHVALQRVAEAECHGQHRERDRRHQPRRGIAARHRHARDDRKRTEDDEVALRRVGEPHHAEHQRLAEREQRVEAAEQHALNNGFKHGRPPRCRSRPARSARA
jgi:hypothetical protein